jgi:hypothetical protein
VPVAPFVVGDTVTVVASGSAYAGYTGRVVRVTTNGGWNQWIWVAISNHPFSMGTQPFRFHPDELRKQV